MIPAYTDKELDEMRACCESDEFYAIKGHRRPPSMVFLVRRLDAAEKALVVAIDLIHPDCGDFANDVAEWRASRGV